MRPLRPRPEAARYLHWLMALSKVVVDARPPEEVDDRVATAAALLDAEAFPADRLTQRALAYVARHARYWPSYCRLRELLDEHAEGLLRLQAPELRRVEAEALAASRAAEERRRAEVAASWRDEALLEATLQSLERVDGLARAAALRVLRAALTRHAPELLPRLPVAERASLQGDALAP